MCQNQPNRNLFSFINRIRKSFVCMFALGERKLSEIISRAVTVGRREVEYRKIRVMNKLTVAGGMYGSCKITLHYISFVQYPTPKRTRWAFVIEGKTKARRGSLLCDRRIHYFRWRLMGTGGLKVKLILRRVFKYAEISAVVNKKDPQTCCSCSFRELTWILLFKAERAKKFHKSCRIMKDDNKRCCDFLNGHLKCLCKYVDVCRELLFAFGNLITFLTSIYVEWQSTDIKYFDCLF